MIISMFLHVYNIYIVLNCCALSLGSWFIGCEILTSKVTMLTIFLHLNKLGLCLGSVADFSDTEVRAITSVECSTCLPAWRPKDFG